MTMSHGEESVKERKVTESVLNALNVLCDLNLDTMTDSRAGYLRTLRLVRWDT